MKVEALSFESLPHKNSSHSRQENEKEYEGEETGKELSAPKIKIWARSKLYVEKRNQDDKLC